MASKTAMPQQSIIMLLTALWDLALECQHLMPYGDVPVLLGFAGVLGVCKARYLASQKAE